MIYLDNAATTQPFPEVAALMHDLSLEQYGNPSSTHGMGRKARAIIEQSRKKIAKIIGATSSEIIFTSGGSESNNIFLRGLAPQVNKIICSPVEHPAVYNTVKFLEQDGHDISWLRVNQEGDISIAEIEELLTSHPGALLVAMHGNNEIGNLNNIELLANIAKKHQCLFFTDAVQTMGHYHFDLGAWPITGLSASAHKFHGPKGTGFLYVRKGTKLHRGLYGGEQEKGLRPGTENVAGIAGMAEALKICYQNLNETQLKIRQLKNQLKDLLEKVIPDIQFNGTKEPDRNMNNILSASFAPHEENEMLQFNLDMAGVAVSAGSACASGAIKDSHVMAALGHPENRAVIRFSLSRFTKPGDISIAVEKIREIYR